MWKMGRKKNEKTKLKKNMNFNIKKIFIKKNKRK